MEPIMFWKTTHLFGWKKKRYMLYLPLLVRTDWIMLSPRSVPPHTGKCFYPKETKECIPSMRDVLLLFTDVCFP